MKLPRLKSKRSKIITLVIVIVILLLVIAGVIYANKPEPVEDVTVNNTVEVDTAPVIDEPIEEPPKEEPAPPTTTPPPATTPPVSNTSQWPVQLTSSQAASITVVVNKKHKLPSTYVPALASIGGGQLRPEAASAFNSLLSAAKAGGATNMTYVSGYRSYAKQEQLYYSYVEEDGQAAADTYSARPGHSEHQTGLAVDIGEAGSCDLLTCFENTTSAKWAAANAHKYGFVIRYPKGKDSITGYQYEPWHLRYLGVSEATAVFNSGKTLEEYYGIPGGGY